MPVPAPDEDDPVFEDGGFRIQLLLRSPDDLLLGLLPGHIDLVQLMRQLLGALLLLAEDELQRGDGVVHPARRVDAGRDGIADVLGRDGPARQTDFFQQGRKARPVGLLQQFQARLDEGAVLAGQRHDVRHGAHGGQVAAVVQHLFRRAAVQRRTEFEGHPRAAQALERAVIVGAAGVHDGHCVGQGVVGQVVVRHDEVHTQRSRKVGFFQRRDAVVHRDDELTALVVDGLHGVFRKAVAVALAAGQHTLDVCAHPLEVLVQQGRGRHAVYIIVAVNNDGLFFVDGFKDAGTGFVHVRQEHGVAQLFLARQQRQRLGGVGDAARSQDARQQARFLLLCRQRGGVFLLAPGFIVQSVLLQFFGVLFRNGGGQLLEGGAVKFL